MSATVSITIVESGYEVIDAAFGPDDIRLYAYGLAP